MKEKSNNYKIKNKISLYSPSKNKKEFFPNKIVSH